MRAMRLVEAAGLDMGDWWELSANGYLRHLPKARILATVEQVGTPTAASSLGKLKKEELVSKSA